MGSRGQKKKRVTSSVLRANDDSIICQRRGLLESHGMSDAHRQAHEKYLTFIDRMRFDRKSPEDTPDEQQSI